MSFLYLQILKGCGTGPAWGIGTSGMDEEVGKGHGKVNIVQMLCAHVCKWQNENYWNYSKNGGRENKENDGEGELKYDVFDIS
jgi:hypothetical protein